MSQGTSSDTGQPHAAQFATTHWSVVLAAGQRSTPQSQQALVDLCETYWYPLYAYARRQGYQAADAQELVQEFFARVLEQNILHSADPERGRFRSFLLVVLKRFLATQRDRQAAQKRGGDHSILSLDFRSGEGRFCREPAHDWTAERVYERQWALTMLDQVLKRIGAEYRAEGKAELYDQLKIYLTSASDSPKYGEVAETLQMSEGAVKVAVHRLRRRYRELLREEVSQTLASSDDVASELDHLLNAVRGGG